MEFLEMRVLPQVLLIRAVVNSGSIPIDGNPHIATMLVENLMGLQAVRRCLNFPLVVASAMKCCASGGNSVPIKIQSSSTIASQRHFDTMAAFCAQEDGMFEGLDTVV